MAQLKASQRKPSELKAYILCRFADKSSVYTSWMDACPLECVVVDANLGEWEIPDDAGIVVTHMHYRWEEISKLREILERGKVPVLILADGILEYRNTWEHQELADGAIFQPVVGHKLACIGRGQVRIVESWGNAGKCELVGLPRLDDVTRDSRPVSTSGPFRLLVATANTPSFNDEQREAVIESLAHLKSRIEANPKANGRIIEVTWRLTDGLETEIDVPMDGDPEDRPPLSDVIDGVDAVITTPSTLYLESLLRKRPTAVMDFHNSPQYVTAAWTINAPKHLNWILRELADPPLAKMMFQEFVLHDQLHCATPSVPRMIELIGAMVDAGIRARESGKPIELTPRILTDPQHGFAPVPEGFSMSELYPDNAVFRNDDLALLQTELIQAIARLDTLPAELAEKNVYVTQTIQSLDAARARSAKMQANAIESHERHKELHERHIWLKDHVAQMTKQIEALQAATGKPEQDTTDKTTANKVDETPPLTKLDD